MAVRGKLPAAVDATGQFAEYGYVGPLRVLSAPECRDFLRAADDSSRLPPLDWPKGHAVSSPAFCKVAKHPAILDVVVSILGPNVILWGASVLDRPPGFVHPWHSDIESAIPSGKTLAVWLGLEHTNRDSTLLILPGSQRFSTTVQEVRHVQGKGRLEVSNDDILRWARARDNRSQLVSLDMTDGEALFFDGRLWHASENRSPWTRRALLLQYAAADTAIRIPDLNFLDWPFQVLERPRPPCLLVRGNAMTEINRIVSPPVSPGNASGPRLTSLVHPAQLPVAANQETGWQLYPLFRGCTADLLSLACHVSMLCQGRRPHAPHAHTEEELLLLLEGEVDVILGDGPSVGPGIPLKPGEFVYHPAHFCHSLETTSAEPAKYLMFKWHSAPAGSAAPLAFGQFDLADSAAPGNIQKGFSSRVLFEGATAYLRKLHCHVTALAPGAGYDPHIDAYDVTILVLEGEVETLGQRVARNGVIFYPAGEPHGMRNPGPASARYVVFEFHGGRVVNGCEPPAEDAVAGRRRSLLGVARRWTRSLQCFCRHFPAMGRLPSGRQTS